MILVEVSKLEGTMRKLYDRFVTVQKTVFHVHGLQQQTKEFVQNLNKIHATIAHVQEWTMCYKWSPLDLVKKMKPQEDLEKEKV